MKTILLFSSLLAVSLAGSIHAHDDHDHDHSTPAGASLAQPASTQTSLSQNNVHSHTTRVADLASEAPTPPPADNLIVLDAQQIKNLQLQRAEVIRSDFEQTLFALGRIEIFPGHLSIVSSRIPGRAVSVPVKADQAVQAGDILLVIESRQPGEPPPRITLTASTGGILAAVNVAPGQPVTPDDSLMQIVDLSEVHAIARVPEHFAGQLQPGQRAHIRVPGYPGKVFSATLAHLGVQVDPQTGTLEAAFHVPNPEKLLRPGMRAEFSIVTEKRTGVVSIPREAVQGDANGRFVYVVQPKLENAFARTPVSLGTQNDTRVEVLAGLAPGQQVVTHGAYALNFFGQGNVSLKAAMDAAHGHAHAEDGSELPKQKTPTTTTPANKTEKSSAFSLPPCCDDDHDQASHAAHDHDHENGAAHTTGLTWFFATLSGLLALLLVLSLIFRKKTPAA